MSVLSDAQDNFVIERSAENVMPISVFDDLKVHHESLDLLALQKLVEEIGGEVVSEGYHV